MIRRTQPVLPLLTLTLLLVAGLPGCKKGSEGEAAEAQKNATAAPAAQAAAPGQAQPAPAGSANALPPAGMPPMASSQDAQKPADPAKLPNVVARVNGQEIKKADLLQEAAQMQQQLARAQGIQAPLTEKFYKEVLDAIVARTLLQQEAKADNVALTDAEVDQQLAAIKSQAPSPEAFKQALATNGLTEDGLKQRIRREGTVQKLVQTKVLSKVTVSDQQAKEFFDKNPERMKRPERVHVRQIVVEAGAQATSEDKQKAKAKADDLHKRLQGGEDFAKVSTGDPKVHAGDAWLTHGEAPPVLDKAAFALSKPNEVSPVLESPVGYHVLQLMERQAAEAATFDQVKGQITQFLKQRQAQEAIAAHVQELKSKGKVEIFL